MTACAAVFIGIIAIQKTVRAGTLYVCEGPNGVKAYQDKPCPSKTKTVRTGAFKSTPYTPPAVVETPVTVSDQAVAAPPPPRFIQQPEPETVGWICETGTKRWLQFTPCPPTYMRSAPVDVDGVIAGTGQMVHGIGSVGVPVPVQTTPLDSNGVCAALGDSSLRIPHHGSSDVYERNVLRGKFCGG
jgi:hypothetical protein